MSSFKKTFLDKCSDSLDEYLSDCSIKLEQKNKSYRRLIDKREQILDKYPRVRFMLEDDIDCNFNFAESKAVKKICELQDDISVMEQKEMFYQGIREAYYFLKNQNII